MPDFQTFDLGKILATAESIKAQKRAAMDDQLHQQIQGEQLTALKQSNAQGLAQESTQKTTQDAQRASAEADHMAVIPDAQLSQFVATALPHVAAAAQQAGIDPNDVQGLRQLASTVGAKAKAYLGQGPAQPKMESVAPGASLVRIAPNGGPATPLYTAPEKPQADSSEMQQFQQYKKDGGKGGIVDFRRSVANAERAPAAASQQGVPSGYRWSQATPGQLEPIPGGPADKNTGLGTGLDSRSGLMFQRVLSSANEASQALANVVQLPVGASTGWLGVGGAPGHGLLASVKGVLTNKVASQEVQDYNTMLAGVKRNLATIETAGLAAAGSLTESFGSLELREGDTEITKLRKLAEMRQIIEKGLETNLDNPKMPKQQVDAVHKIIEQVTQSVPFTHSDITRLQREQEKNPNTTLEQLISQKGLRDAKPGETITHASGAKITILPATH